MLTQPIAPLLFDSPQEAYAELTANLQPGQKYVQSFDHLCVENPAASEQRYLEAMYPNATVLGTDLDVGSESTAQLALGSCGTFANISAYSCVPQGCKYRLEEAIYPLEPSPYGLYLIRVQDPKNPLGVKWVAIDSQVPTMPGKNSSNFFSVRDCLAPGLFLKAAATMRGGAWNSITNSDSFGIRFSWFPSASVTCKTFAEFSAAIANGSLCVFAMSQQIDSMGVNITPPGVVMGHAFSAPSTLEVAEPDGTVVQLVRICNPWGGGSEYVSDFSENAPFWAAHPELEPKLNEAKTSGGNYWVSWNQFCQLAGQTSFDVTHPLPLPSHPYIKYLPYTFDDSTAIASATTANLKALAEARKDYIDITLTESTPILASLKWAKGTGDRHTSIILVDPTGKVSGTQTVYWAGSKTVTIYAKAGVNRIYLRTSKMSVDRGDLQVTLMAAKEFGLSVGGAIV